MDAPRLVVVVGMHRSGTSAVTRGLAALGVDLGDRLMPPGADNRTGYWEDLDVVALNEELLAGLGAEWHSVKLVSCADLADPKASALVQRAADMLGAKLRPGRVFGMKDPRVARLLPFWKKVFARLEVDARWVVAVRNPLSVERSLSARNAFDPVKSLVLWLQHTVPAVAETQGQPRVVVDYDRLMDDPAAQLARISRALGLGCDDHKAPRIVEYCGSFLQRDLRHSRFAPDDPALVRVLPVVAGLYGALRRMAGDAGSSDELADSVARAALWLDDSAPLLERLWQAERVPETADARIAALEDEHRRQAEAFDAAIAERDARIAALEDEHRRQTAAFNAALAERDLRLAALRGALDHWQGEAQRLGRDAAARGDRDGERARRPGLAGADPKPSS